MKNLLYFLAIVSSPILLSGCKSDDPEPCPVVKEPYSLSISHLYNGELQLFKTYKSFQGNDMWFTVHKFYVSNVVAVKENGEKSLIADIFLVDYSLDSAANAINGNIEQGNYVAIEFDLGVREDYNASDPAIYENDHPLSYSKDMYWGWATMYKFSEFEGFEVSGNDTNSFLIHTGTQDLYRPGVKIDFNFNVPTGGTESSINLDLYTLLYESGYVFDLYNNGQTHTLDSNKQLAVHFMDNFSQAFSK